MESALCGKRLLHDIWDRLQQNYLPHYGMETFRGGAHIAAGKRVDSPTVDIKTAFLRGVLEQGASIYEGNQGI